jgi:hypothetical protein
METRKLLDDMMGQPDDLMKNSFERGLKGHTVTPDEQNIIDSMRAKMVALLKREMNWENLKPFYLQIYRESFIQEKVDGMLTFYETPSGQAVIKKLPIVLQKTMAEMQRRMGPLHQKLQELQKETLDELKAKNNIK